MEETVEVITLENGLDFMVLDEIASGAITYVYLANVDDERDTCVRKVTKENGKEMLNGLDSKEELEKALLLFAKKHKNEI